MVPFQDFEISSSAFSAFVFLGFMIVLKVEETQRPEARRSRRSTRISYDVLVELQGERFAYAGETSVVNLHGALIRTAAPLELGTQITIHVQQTGKAAPGRVVFASYELPVHYGVELEKPANIWGLTDTPSDWQEILNQP